MYDGFVKRARAVERLLHDRRTTFVVVSTLEAVPLREAEFFLGALRERSLPLGALVLNKTLPAALLDPAGEAAARAFTDGNGALADALAATGDAALADPARTARLLATLADSYRNFNVIAKREAELRAEMAASPDLVLTVPLGESDVADLAALDELAHHLFERSP